MVALKAGSGLTSARCFKYITEAYGRWKIIIFLTHLFNARKGSLSSGVRLLCGIDLTSGGC
jgi:hypothetical protein